MVSRAVVSTEIVDILAAAGIKSPDISILSDEFLAEIQGMKKRNLALEALQKLINGEIKSRTKSNIVQSKKFSERLEAAVRRYHNNAITAAQLLEELIGIAKDIKAERARGEEQGLSLPPLGRISCPPRHYPARYKPYDRKPKTSWLYVPRYCHQAR